MLPTINEADNLRVLLPMLRDYLAGYDWFIVVVDDGSTDGTPDVVAEFAKATNRAELIERGTRLGLGSAIKTGMRACLDRDAKSIVVMDADLQHPPNVVPGLVNAVLKDGVDLAIASRYIRGGGITGWSLRRYLISKGATYMARLLMPWARNIKDPISGFFAVNASRLRGVIDMLSDSSGYKLILELLSLMHARYGDSFKVVEVPYVFRNRMYGVSKLSTRELINYVQLVLKLSNYSVPKYLVSLVLGSFIGYLFFNVLSGISPIAGNLISIELSLISVITIYQLLMGMKPQLQYYVKYHLIKYVAVAVKLALYTVSTPTIIALIISGAIQLLMTLRIITINPAIMHML